MDSEHRSYVADYLTQSVAATSALANDAALQDVLFEMADRTVAAFRAGRKLLIAGNGGSAADAQHIAAEFTGRLMYDRAPLPAIALTTDSSALTAIGNDYGFDQVFERQVRALGQSGDILIAISTSGNSPNIRRAIAAAKDNGVQCFAFTGPAGGAMAEVCDLIFRAPGTATAFVQQIHITAAHIYCALIEREMFPLRNTAAA